MISNIWQYSKNFYRSRRWLYNWLFSRLSLFQKYYKLIEIDLTKQQKQDADPEAINQINFTGNIDRERFSDVFHYWRSERDSFRFFKKNS